jgi:hypothetical protein
LATKYILRCRPASAVSTLPPDTENEVAPPDDINVDEDQPVNPDEEAEVAPAEDE